MRVVRTLGGRAVEPGDRLTTRRGQSVIYVGLAQRGHQVQVCDLDGRHVRRLTPHLLGVEVLDKPRANGPVIVLPAVERPEQRPATRPRRRQRK